MKLVIYHIGIPNHANLRLWEPEDPDVISEHALVNIGPKGKKGADDFFLHFATPRGLERLPAKEGIIASRTLVVMARYDYGSLWAWLEQTVAACERGSWEESVEALRMYFVWEYDGMRGGTDA